MPVLSVKNISIAFGKKEKKRIVVDNVSWELQKGEILGIIGESGSGKTLSCLALLQLTPPAAEIIQGTALFDGTDLLSTPHIRTFRGKRIGYIFQEPRPAFDPIYPIGKTMIETLRNTYEDESPDILEDRAVELLKEMHIPQPKRRIKNYSHQFSGGMLQRVMIALALAQKPEILIADEATTSLDVTIQAEIVQLVFELKKKHGLSIIFISHDISLVSGIADRIMVMEAGNIRELNETKRLITEPEHVYTKMLLSNVISMEGRKNAAGG